MSDAGADGADEEPEPADAAAGADDEAGRLADTAVPRYLRLGAIGLLALLAVVSTLQLYLNAQSAISRWVAPEYVSAFLAAFNLVVLLLTLAGLGLLTRAYRSDDD